MKLFIFAGESSGDVLGSSLMQALKNIHPKAHFSGVGGPGMRAEGMTCILPMEDFRIMGFSEVIKSLPKLWKHFSKVLNTIIDTKPDCVILIDYPGFNLRLAKKLRKKGFKGKIVQYVCPTVWAHGKHRVQTMVETLDLLLSIFPFESDFLKDTPLKVKYVGHPMNYLIQNHVYDQEWMPPANNLVAIFCGSRKGEIKQNLPFQLEAARLLKEKYPDLKFGLSCAHTDLVPTIVHEVKKSAFKVDEDLFLVEKKYRYELMKNSKYALAKSGTITLELALHLCPSVVVYKVSFLNYLFAKFILNLKLRYYCMVNILANKEVFPEVIGKFISPQRAFNHLEKIHLDEPLRNKIKQDCRIIKNSLGNENPNSIAAQAIIELLK